jgi:hypothetical protein
MFITGMKKNYPSKFFAFIAGVIGSPDNVIRNYLREFSKKFETIPMGY